MYVSDFKPVYIVGLDTMAVARIPVTPDSINRFLYECMKAKNYAPLKYTYKILQKLIDEYTKVDRQDYDLYGVSSESDGFIQMAWIFLKIDIAKDEEAQGIIFCSDVANMLYKKRNKIKGWGR